jgi:hypothetical protein
MKMKNLCLLVLFVLLFCTGCDPNSNDAIFFTAIFYGLGVAAFFGFIGLCVLLFFGLLFRACPIFAISLFIAICIVLMFFGHMCVFVP